MGVALSRPHAQPQITVNATSSGIVYGPYVMTYTSFDSGFISAIIGAAFLSGFSVVTLLFINIIHPPSHIGDCTHIPLIFGSLIASNLLQSIGTIFSARWVSLGRVSPGTLCSLQGGLKQAGNIGVAVWSFTLALHAFLLLFLRTRLTTCSKWFTFALGWTFIVIVVAICPLAIQQKDRGPYFGPSGFWCWITKEYHAGRIFLEYMLEWMSAFFSFVLYVTVLLRVRGNLTHDAAGKWALRWIPRSESWQLGFVRDYLDSCTVRLATIIVWYPVTYTMLIVPISVARFASYRGGARVPHGFILVADLIYALGGFANLLLFVSTRRFMPDVSTTPHLSTPRSHPDKRIQTYGITPFVLPATREAEEKPDVMMAAASDGDAEFSVSFPDTKTESGMETPDPRASVATYFSDASQGSMQPLNP